MHHSFQLRDRILDGKSTFVIYIIYLLYDFLGKRFIIKCIIKVPFNSFITYNTCVWGEGTNLIWPLLFLHRNLVIFLHVKLFIFISHFFSFILNVYFYIVNNKTVLVLIKNFFLSGLCRNAYSSSTEWFEKDQIKQQTVSYPFQK